MLLSVIQARLTAMVPAYDSVPSSDQYGQAVEDAVNDFSNRRPLVKTTTLNLVDDTADYDLPSDFLRVIRLRAPEAADYYTDTWEVKDVDTITFYPTPDTAHDLTLRYCAKHAGTASNGDTDCADLTDADARVLLYKAKAYCLEMQADKAARDAWQYSEGEQVVNKTKQSEAFRKMAEAAHSDYLRELKALPTGVGAREGLTEMARSGD